ncbi:CHAT domain-containing protein [Algoriphagus sp.]|uniref:CHAT domain-containing protein n=1 Tax=Algoriphagus sp. TaxID=1872435 RepID=UPI003F719A70
MIQDQQETPLQKLQATQNPEETSLLLDQFIQEVIWKMEGKNLDQELDQLLAIVRSGESQVLEQFLGKVEPLDLPQSVQLEIFKKTAQYYSDQGELSKTKAIYEDLLGKFGEKISLEESAKLKSDLGEIFHRMGELSQSKKWHLEARGEFERSGVLNGENQYISAQNLGLVYWYQSQFDSSFYYFGQAMELLEDLEPSPVNQVYRKAMLKSNLAGLYNFTGQAAKSMEELNSAVLLLDEFIRQNPDAKEREQAQTNFFNGKTNLAGIYRGIGDYHRALKLLLEADLTSREHLQGLHPKIVERKIMIGQTYRQLKDHTHAETWLKEAQEDLEQMEGGYPLMWGDLHYTLALLYEEKSETSQAEFHYDQAGSNYGSIMSDFYDPIFLEYMGHAADFYSKNQKAHKGLEMVRKALDYSVWAHGEQVDRNFLQYFFTARVLYNVGQFEESKRQVIKAEQLLTRRMKNAESLIDSLQAQLELPQIILLKSQLEDQLNKENSLAHLQQVDAWMEDALDILEVRKTLLYEIEDQGILTARNRELMDFYKSVLLRLYSQTQEENYLDKLLTLHESSIYARLRSRILAQKSVKFRDVPAEWVMREDSIRAQFDTMWEEGGERVEFDKLLSEWKAFLDELKSAYPAYFELRYGKAWKEFVFEPAQEPLIQWIQVNDQLCAVVETKGKRNFVDIGGIPGEINKLLSKELSLEEYSQAAFALYQQLWKPIEQYIGFGSVTVIPDGRLFSLNLEQLVREELALFEGIRTKTLLNDYAFSYAFSRSQLDQIRSETYSERAIAFAPVFSDEMKDAYKSQNQVSDLVMEDYLRLLPQPFALDLAEKVAKEYNGTSYLFEASSIQNFRGLRGSFPVLQLATHAFSNNISPERSYLVFAKEKREVENHLYAYELYDQKIDAGLVMLTACETGQPVYQAGEGMISLAHAFNYAGSESLLTSLTKTDEQAGAIISEYFLDFVASGRPLDQALQLAKLEYLKNSRGRALMPTFWSGLIVMGQKDPIALKKEGGFPYYFIIGVLAVLLSVIFFIFIKSKKAMLK